MNRICRDFAVLMSLLFATALPAEPANATTFFNNLWASNGGTDTAIGPNWLAGSFTTDDAEHTKLSATLLLARSLESTSELALYSDAGQKPGSLLATFPSPSYSSSLAPTTFTKSLVELAPDTTYWLVFRAIFGSFNWGWTDDPTIRQTWGQSLTAGQAWLTPDDFPFQYSVSGLQAGDFNNDNAVNVADIDLLTAHIRTGGNNSLYDVNEDTLVNHADLKFEVETILGVDFGDTELDGDVDLSDLGTVATNFARPGAFGWASGNFDADIDVDLADLGALASNFQSGSAQSFADFNALIAAGVPEPASSVALLAMAALTVRARRNRST
jgi:hypothetical protein